MNINKNTLFSLVVAGIIAGSAVGYSGYNYHLKKNTVIKQEAALAKFSEEDMASMASLIVEGKILNISETRWNTVDGKQPLQVKFEDTQYNEVLISPEHIYKGNVKDNTPVKVRVFGGTYTENGQVIEDCENIAPQFSKNEEVIVFLANDDSPYNKDKSNDYYAVLGSKQGKYSVNGDIIQSSERKVERKDLEANIEKYKNTEPRIKRGNGKI